MDKIMWMTLLNGCCKLKQKKMAKKIFEKNEEQIVIYVLIIKKRKKKNTLERKIGYNCYEKQKKIMQMATDKVYLCVDIMKRSKRYITFDFFF